MKRFSQLEYLGLSLAGILVKEDLSPIKELNLSLLKDEIVKQKLNELHLNFHLVISVKQKHTNNVVVIDTLDAINSKSISQTIADGIITNQLGIVLTITVADCVPIFLFDAKNKVVGLVHAGREGTRKKIVANTLNCFFNRFDSVPNNIYALIGPSIGPCCYEVSEDLAQQCLKDGLVVIQRSKVDLWTSNILQIQQQGIPTSNIFLTQECTCCSNTYYSYRRGDRALRNFVITML